MEIKKTILKGCRLAFFEKSLSGSHSKKIGSSLHFCLLSFVLFSFFGCFHQLAPPSSKIEDAKFLLSVASESPFPSPFHLKKAKEFLSKARAASSKNDTSKTSDYALLSSYESSLSLELSKEKASKIQFAVEKKKLKEAKAVYEKEKAKILKLRKELDSYRL